MELNLPVVIYQTEELRQTLHWCNFNIILLPVIWIGVDLKKNMSYQLLCKLNFMWFYFDNNRILGEDLAIKYIYKPPPPSPLWLWLPSKVGFTFVDYLLTSLV